MLPPVLGKFLFFHICQFLTFNGNASCIYALDPANDIQKRGFAGTGWTQKHTKFSFFNIQIQTLEDIYPAVPGAK